MKARANTDNKFLYKYLLIGIGTFLFSLYCFYDAFVNYPSQRPASVAYDKLLEDIEDQKEAAGEDAINWAEIRESRWQKISEAEGWANKPPHYTADDLKNNINFSIFLGAICGLIAAPCFFWFIKNRGTWVEIDGSRLTSSNGQSVNFSDIQTFDKKRWVKKGLATIHYSDDGADKTFVVDDLKYERTIVDQMVAEIEAAIPADKIINGPTEVEIAEEREAKQAARQARLKELEGADAD